MSSFWVAAALAAALNQTPANQPPAPPRTSASAPSNPFVNLLPNLATDVRALASESTAFVMGVGGAATIASHNNDLRIRDWVLKQPKDPALAKIGNVAGDAYLQGGLAVATWVAGRQSKNMRLERVGSDLVRAQILNGVLTVPLKYIADRERPDAGRHSFPSGHTSATFTTAAVIQRDFGVAASIPFYALGGLVSWSRIRTNHHWLSDDVFGAAIGITAGYAATKSGTGKWSVTPVKTKGGAAIYFTRR
jgi:membrane-associated phospholipid phosphatase